MEKDVLVRVKGTFIGPGGESDGNDLEIIAPGQYYKKNGASYIIYEEMDESFTEPIKNTIKITTNGVSLRKTGPVLADMRFEKGEERMATYTTPFGSLVLGIVARELTVDAKSDDELSIRLGYDLEIEYEHTSECVIDIDVKSKSMGMFPLQ